MPRRKPEVISTVTRPGGLEAVYERHADGSVTRTVRKAKAPAKAPETTTEEVTE